MTGVDELREVAVVPAAPETIRVSVLGERTQVDVTLPADIPVATLLPELVQLIESRNPTSNRESADRDQRRTFWTLGRSAGGQPLAAERTLRAAGVGDGELLHLEPRPALTPPTLYDDVVEAAANLHRAAYAPWDAAAAAAMAVAGLWGCAGALAYLLVADQLSGVRGVVIGCAVAVFAMLVIGSIVVRGVLDRPRLAEAVAVAAIALGAALGWTVAQPVRASELGGYAIVAYCAVMLVGLAAYYRALRVGHWLFIGTTVVYAGWTVGLGSVQLGAPSLVVAVVGAVVATLCPLAVPALTEHLNRPVSKFPADDGSAPTVPAAEVVRAQVHSATLTRAGLLGGLAVLTGSAALAMLHVDYRWSTAALALACAAAMALRCRGVRTVTERLVLAVPAGVLVIAIAVRSAAETGGPAALALLAAVVVTATLLGAQQNAGKTPRWVRDACVHFEYAVFSALVPLALWPLGIYERLGG